MNKKGIGIMKRDLLKTIEEKMPTFSKGQKAIAHYILEHYEKAAYLTASKLGSFVNVSESTVVRFALELGFDGYPELQRALQEMIRTKLTSLQRIEVANDLIGDGDLLTKVLMSDVDKIRHTLENIDADAFNTAVDKIIGARTIYIMGVRSSSMLAGFLDYSFRLMFDNVKLIQTTSGSELFEQIMQIGKEDVMIAISFPRYSKRIINAVDFASSAGANVISLTDSEFSPIADKADQLLVAETDMAAFVDSLAAALSVIDAIVIAVSRKKQDELSERFARLEKIWDEYDVYDKSHS